MTNKPIEVRLSEERDARQLADLDSSGIWDVTNAPVPIGGLSAAEYAERNPPGSKLVAVCGETICGYVGFSPPTPLPSNGHVTQLYIAVHPSFQRMGVGSRLIEAAKRHAAAQGKRKLSLRVLATNEKALAFYKSCGFTEQGRLVDEFYLDGRYVDDVIMYVMV